LQKVREFVGFCQAGAFGGSPNSARSSGRVRAASSQA
jgi:hypothetical protein